MWRNTVARSDTMLNGIVNIARRNVTKPAEKPVSGKI
jgi:hypothetical protein